MDDDGNSTTTRLLTLLNVSALKAGKRKHIFDDSAPGQKLNKRRSIRFSDEKENGGEENGESEVTAEEVVPELDNEEEEVNPGDPYEIHFGPNPPVLTEPSRAAIDRNAWTTSRNNYGRLGLGVEYSSEGFTTAESSKNAILERLRAPFEARQSKLPKDQTELQNNLLETLSSQRDLYISSTSLDDQKSTRETIALHALNHVTKKRRRVLKNSERLAHAAKSTSTPAPAPPTDVLDQGFTRPSILLLLPIRASALAWLSALTVHSPSQIENRARFNAEYGLPPGAQDKLASAPPGTYPRDHVVNFSGNIDDNFRVGVKLTRKSVKLFAEFYGCDIIMASPLGLRMSIEKEKSADFLSSIEVLVVDQMDVLAMQNWEHVQFVFEHLNALPKASHNTDFSRVKPWYLDGHAAYLRQSILLSAFETPATRSLFNSRLRNVAGRVRTTRRWPPLAVPAGIAQEFVRFDCASPQDEADKRFTHFTTQLLPTVLKSAVQSANTLVFVPSSFDFIRVHNYFRKHAGVSFAVLSEYSSNSDISRARQAFFSGKKAFLLISERFHFYRRYKIRGVRNLLFYGPPDHAAFYAELLAFPFLDEGVEAAEVTCKVMYSKWDWFALERIAGTEGAGELVRSG